MIYTCIKAGSQGMNSQEVALKELPKRKVLFLSCRGSWRQLPDMLTKLSEHMALNNKEALGPPSGVFFNTPEDVAIEDLSWDVCYPISLDAPITTNGKTKSGVRETPMTRVVSIIHVGSYRKTSSSYEKLQAWIKAHSLMVCGPAEEVYLVDICRTNEEQRIEIRLPVCPARL